MSILRRRSKDAHTAVDAALGPHPDRIAIGEAPARRRVVVEGQVVRMRARPTSGQPSLAVTISDDTGSITAVWTGRRAIGGITLGRKLRIEGVAAHAGDTLEFTNPAYTLLP
ncbi:MAG: OB-fold nucleic acid binding domain-containing protein [Acidimicrobiales bacterium]